MATRYTYQELEASARKRGFQIAKDSAYGPHPRELHNGKPLEVFSDKGRFEICRIDSEENGVAAFTVIGQLIPLR